jgi:hypothetical protein
MMFPPVLWSSSQPPAAEISGVIATWMLGPEAHFRLCAACVPTRPTVSSAAAEVTRTAAACRRGAKDRRTVTRVRATSSARGTSRSRPKRCGKPLYAVRLLTNSSRTQASSVACASTADRLPRLHPSPTSRSAPSRTSHATGWEIIVPIRRPIPYGCVPRAMLTASLLVLSPDRPTSPRIAPQIVGVPRIRHGE